MVQLLSVDGISPKRLFTIKRSATVVGSEGLHQKQRQQVDPSYLQNNAFFSDVPAEWKAEQINDEIDKEIKKSAGRDKRKKDEVKTILLLGNLYIYL